MAMIYGHRWTSSYGERDDGTWLKGLHGVTPAQIGIGLEKCRDSGDEWAPTLPLFRERCLAKEFAAPYHRPFPPALPRPPADPEVARQNIAKMKSMLAKPSRYSLREAEPVLPISESDEERAERLAIQREGA